MENVKIVKTVGKLILECEFTSSEVKFYNNNWPEHGSDVNHENSSVSKHCQTG